MTDALPGDAPRPFVLLDGVSAAEPDHLTAWRRFGSAPMWQGLEAAAQAARPASAVPCGILVPCLPVVGG